LKPAASVAWPSCFLGAAWLLAFCSLGYELALAKLVAELTGEPTLWESLSMGGFLLGIGLRSLRFRPAPDRELARRLLVTETHVIALAVTATLSIVALEMLYRIYVFSQEDWGVFFPFPPVYLVGALAQLATFAIGWFSGYELQFFLAFGEGRVLRRQESKVLAVYHLGGLGGTLFFSWSVSRGWSPTELVVASAVVNCGVLLWLGRILEGWSSKEGRREPLLRRRQGLMAAAALGIGALAIEPLEGLSRQNRYFNRLDWSYDGRGLYQYEPPVGPFDLLGKSSQWPAVERIRTPYQVIDVVRASPDADVKAPLGALHINGRFQIGTRSSAAYHELMAHVPIGLARHAVRRVLVLGGGDGALVHELRKYQDTLEEVVLVDIDDKMLELARKDPLLVGLNGGATLWSGLEVLVGDAMSFLRETERSFDAIFVDLTYPYEFDSARFYSLEFFRLMHRRLAAHGFFVVGSPVDLTAPESEEWRQTLFSTVHAAGYQEQRGLSARQDHFLVAAKEQLAPMPEIPAEIELESLREASANARESWRLSRLDMVPRKEMVNSVMRPRPLGVRDGFF
jgi:spermidine synthase